MPAKHSVEMRHGLWDEVRPQPSVSLRSTHTDLLMSSEGLAEVSTGVERRREVGRELSDGILDPPTSRG